MTHKDKGHFEIEDRGAVLIVRVDHDPNVHAVVITGAHPKRFISHADVRWLQEGGAASPSVGQRGASAIARAAEIADRARVLEPVVRRTPRWGQPPSSTACTRRFCG